MSTATTPARTMSRSDINYWLRRAEQPSPLTPQPRPELVQALDAVEDVSKRLDPASLLRFARESGKDRHGDEQPENVIALLSYAVEVLCTARNRMLGYDGSKPEPGFKRTPITVGENKCEVLAEHCDDGVSAICVHGKWLHLFNDLGMSDAKADEWSEQVTLNRAPCGGCTGNGLCTGAGKECRA